MALAYLGLGSNLGNRIDYLGKAASCLENDPEIKVIKKSSIKETKPVDVTDQPDFLNQIILIETYLAPEKLLEKLVAIELLYGRSRDIKKGPRTIDIDILLYDDIMMDTQNLTIPHPGILKRDFILDHLIELDPSLSDPVTGKNYREVARHERKKHQ